MCLSILKKLLFAKEPAEESTANLTALTHLQMGRRSHEYHKKTWRYIKQLEEGKDKMYAILQRIDRLSQSQSQSQDDMSKSSNQDRAQAHAHAQLPFKSPQSPPPYAELQCEGGNESEHEREHEREHLLTTSSNQDQDEPQSSTAQEIKDLRTSLRALRHQMTQSFLSAPRDDEYYFYISLVTKQDIDGRPDLWYHNSRICNRSGGCCERGCGCCEKALHENTQIRGCGDISRKELVRVYGHCTAECACCIRVQGVYKPDTRLPEPRVLPEI